MKAAVLCSVAVAVAAMCGSVAGVLPPADRPYKLLMLLPVSTKSHRNMFMALAEALADRGHKVRPHSRCNVSRHCCQHRYLPHVSLPSTGRDGHKSPSNSHTCKHPRDLPRPDRRQSDGHVQQRERNVRCPCTFPVFFTNYGTKLVQRAVSEALV